MEQGLLHAHSWLRWIILLLVFGAIVTSLTGWLGNKPYTQRNKRLALFLTISADIQLLIGLVMYFFTSQITKMARADFGAAMGDSNLRFWAVEHFLMMIIAIALFHIGKVKAAKASTDVQKHKKSVIFYGLGLIALLGGLSKILADGSRMGF